MSIAAIAQGPYQLSWKVDGPLMGAGLLTAGAGHWLQLRTVPLTSAQVDSLDRETIPGIDRATTGNSPYLSDPGSHVFLAASGAAGLSILIDKGIRKDFITIGVMGLEAILITDGLTFLSKGSVLRPRPYMYMLYLDYDEKESRSGRHSFFSGHTSFSACATFFAARVYCDYHPESKIKPLIWSAAVILPAVTGHLRVRSGQHFPTDVFAGYAVGAAIGYLVPVLHRSRGGKDVSLVPLIGNEKGMQVTVRF